MEYLSIKQTSEKWGISTRRIQILCERTLALVANMKSLGSTETIPDKPMVDETGLLMQMIVPVKVISSRGI